MKYKSTAVIPRYFDSEDKERGPWIWIFNKCHRSLWGRWSEIQTLGGRSRQNKTREKNTRKNTPVPNFSHCKLRPLHALTKVCPDAQGVGWRPTSSSLSEPTGGISLENHWLCMTHASPDFSWQLLFLWEPQALHAHHLEWSQNFGVYQRFPRTHTFSF